MMRRALRSAAFLLLTVLSSCVSIETHGITTTEETSVYTKEQPSSRTSVSESSAVSGTAAGSFTAEIADLPSDTFPAQSGVFAAEENVLPYDSSIAHSGIITADKLLPLSLGRTLYSENDETLYFDHSCSGISFSFSGTKLEAVLVSDEKYCGDPGKMAWAAVYIDDSGEPYRRFPLNCEEGVYPIYESELPGEVKITLIKLTEEQFGTAGIRTLTADSDIFPIPKKDRYIEFFGDSITAGYGNEGIASHGFDTSEENGYMTYASITARELDADHSMVCVSGMGLVASRTCDLVARDVYPLTDAFVSDERYSFERQPDLIVINLGANDSYYINKDSSYYELFEERYYELLHIVRERNPDAYLICAICDYWQQRMPQIKRAVEKYADETGDERISTLLLPYVENDEDYGSDYHPKTIVHEQIAKALTDVINELAIFG